MNTNFCYFTAWCDTLKISKNTGRIERKNVKIVCREGKTLFFERTVLERHLSIYQYTKRQHNHARYFQMQSTWLSFHVPDYTVYQILFWCYNFKWAQVSIQNRVLWFTVSESFYMEILIITTPAIVKALWMYIIGTTLS